MRATCYLRLSWKKRKKKKTKQKSNLKIPCKNKNKKGTINKSMKILCLQKTQNNKKKHPKQNQPPYCQEMMNIFPFLNHKNLLQTKISTKDGSFNIKLCKTMQSETILIADWEILGLISTRKSYNYLKRKKQKLKPKSKKMKTKITIHLMKQLE